MELFDFETIEVIELNFSRSKYTKRQPLFGRGTFITDPYIPPPKPTRIVTKINLTDISDGTL